MAQFVSITATTMVTVETTAATAGRVTMEMIVDPPSSPKDKKWCRFSVLAITI